MKIIVCIRVCVLEVSHISILFTLNVIPTFASGWVKKLDAKNLLDTIDFLPNGKVK